jgi:hypothetical protein
MPSDFIAIAEEAKTKKSTSANPLRRTSQPTAVRIPSARKIASGTSAAPL